MTLVLLPPSESKFRGAHEAPATDPSSLSFPALAGARAHLLDIVTTLAQAPDPAAALGLGPALRAEAAANAFLREAPAVPVSRLYTGVLHDALDLPALTPAQARRAQDEVVVVSALWGALRPDDRVAPYRLSMGTRVPGTAPLARYWRAHLAQALIGPASSGPVLDCRSSAYAAAWPVPPEIGARTVTVRVLSGPPGARRVVSHHAKHARGVLAGIVVRRTTPVGDVSDLAGLARTGPWQVELRAPDASSRTWTMDLVLPSP